jgi:hypothetical protein
MDDLFVLYALVAFPLLIPVLILTIYMRRPRHETDEEKRSRVEVE